MELTTVVELVERHRSWFSGSSGSQGQSVKAAMDDARRRYRMIVPDAAERAELGLSALPSTKSVSVVDNAVVDAIQEYYESDALTYSAEDSGEPEQDFLADWLTSIFQVRAKKNGFWVWHVQSLKCGFVDGMEAALVRWRKESYEYPDNHYFHIPSGQEISEDEYKAARKLYPMKVEGGFNPAKGKPDTIRIKFAEHYRAERGKKSRIVTDTWEVTQLKPGENLLWDFKNPVLDINKGTWAVVILDFAPDEILALSKEGLFNKLTLEDLKPYMHGYNAAGVADYTDHTSLAADPDNVDMGDYNRARVWAAFERKQCQWWVSFSLAGQFELSKEALVNDVFFGGRPFDRLPIALGCSDFELWEALGRSIPKLIAPIEDELTDHKNNVNDIAKQAVQGKWRVNEDSDVDLNGLLNDKFFYAKPGEVEKIDMSGEMAVVMRAADACGSDLAELAPVGMQSQFLVPKGSARDTLGGTQLALGQQDKKLSTRLLIRNITFMEPLMRIIAEMEMAFETDEKVGRLAAKKAKLDVNQIMTVIDGKPAVDFSRLDFDAEININAGLGNVPKQQKAQKMLQWSEWAKSNGKPFDIDKVSNQVLLLNGFSEGQFDPAQPPRQQPQAVEYKANITIDLATLIAAEPAAGKFLLDKMMNGGMDVTANIKEQPKKPGYLQEEPQGSPSHPVMAQHGTADQPQSQLGGA